MGSKIGVVDVGGGYRGVYAAGVLDYCLEHNIMFDLGVGVSAGSANVISYAAKQARRNYRFYVKYGMRKEYAGVGNFISKKSFIDMDYVYGTLSNSDGEDPFDYRTGLINGSGSTVIPLRENRTVCERMFLRENNRSLCFIVCTDDGEGYIIGIIDKIKQIYNIIFIAFTNRYHLNFFCRTHSILFWRYNNL